MLTLITLLSLQTITTTLSVSVTVNAPPTVISINTPVEDNSPVNVYCYDGVCPQVSFSPVYDYSLTPNGETVRVMDMIVMY